MSPRNRLKNQGNVLITAIFMSVFLFFLSVALVSSNRMDISLGLSVDHRLKADTAARAGLNWALHTMRTEPDWTKQLDIGPPVLESGAQIKVEVRARSEKEGSSYLLLVTSVGTSGLVSARHWAVVEEVKKVGASKHKKDQIPVQLFSRSEIDNQGKMEDNGLAMMASDFQWYSLATLPTKHDETNTIEANGGPIFAFAPEGTAASPPSFIVSLPMFLPNGNQTQGPPIRLELVPPGRHLMTLQVDPKTKEMKWVDIPDPGTQKDLGKVKGIPEINDEWEKSLPIVKMWEDPRKVEEDDDRPHWSTRHISLTGKGDRDSGFEVFTINNEDGIWDPETGLMRRITDTKPWSEVAYVDSKTTSELTLDWAEITGLRIYLEWYSLVGDALSARGNKIACQAIHTFYGQLPFAGEQKFVDFGTPIYESIVYQAPCVLEYDLDTKKWTRLVDLMEVPSPDTSPNIERSREWRPNFLKVDSEGRPYITTKKRITAETPETNLVRYNSLKWTSDIGTIPDKSKAPRAVLYEDRPYYLNQNGYLEGTSIPRRFLTGFHGKQLDPNKALGGTVPAISAFIPEGEGEEQQDVEYQLKPTEQISAGLAGDRFDIVTRGKDLYALGLVRREVEDLKDIPRLGDFNHDGEYALTTDKTIATIFHYDGENWQIWPGGGSDLLKTFGTSASTNRMLLPGFKMNAAGSSSQWTPTDIRLLANQGLALASYPLEFPDLNRYSVIAAGKNTPPSLKGFEAE